MSLDIWQKKIQERRKNTPFRDFLLEVASWYTINLYKKDSLLTKYPDNGRTPHVIVEKDYYSLGNQLNTAEYDLTIGFFEHFRNLWSIYRHPQIHTFKQNENSNFSDVVFGAKNAYLSFTVGNNAENIFYSTIVYTNCSNVYNSVKVTNNCQNIYYSKSVTQSFNIYYSRYINNSSDIRFSSNLTGCKHCLMCDNLVNQQYCIANESYDKITYEHKKKELLSNKSSFDDYFAQVNNRAINYNADNCFGEGVSFSRNIKNGYYVARAIDGHNMMFIEGVDHANNYYDVFEAGVNSDDFYAVSNAGTGANHLYCSRQIESSNHLFYCYYMENCSYCLGCMGLKNVSYCILNKQYNKEDRHEMVDKIFFQMEEQGSLGLVGPGWINPFYFNDTAAYLIDSSFTKEEVMTLGYLWRDEPVEVDVPIGAEVISVDLLGEFESFSGDGNWVINKDILDKIILDGSGNYYRIVNMEYDFLVKHGLPLPRKHRLDRMKQNFTITLN